MVLGLRASVDSVCSGWVCCLGPFVTILKDPEQIGTHSEIVIKWSIKCLSSVKIELIITHDGVTTSPKPFYPHDNAF